MQEIICRPEIHHFDTFKEFAAELQLGQVQERRGLVLMRRAIVVDRVLHENRIEVRQPDPLDRIRRPKGFPQREVRAEQLG